MFKPGDIVVYNNSLWRITGEYRLNGTVKIIGVNGQGYTFARGKHLQLATSLVKELI